MNIEKMESCYVFKMVYNLNNTFYFQGLQLTDAIPKVWKTLVQNNVNNIDCLTVSDNHIIRKNNYFNEKIKRKGAMLNFDIKCRK